MRAVTIAAAGAAVIGSVAASSHVKHMHAQRNANVARDTWLDWNSTSVVDSPTGVDGGKTSTSTKWGPGTKTTDPVTDVDGGKGSTTTTKWGPGTKTTDPVTEVDGGKTSTTNGWGDHGSKTSSTPVDGGKTSTTSKVVSSSTTTSAEHTWEDWSSSSTSSKVVDPATSSSTEVDHTWADWESTSTKPVDPATTKTSEDHTWADWESSTSVDPAKTTSTVEHTWADWESSTSSKPVDPVSEDPSHTWVDWVEPTTTVTLKSTVTTTKYVEPVTSDPASTWADWEATSSSAIASSKVAPVTSVLTSTITAGWSATGWFGPAWTVDPGSCAVSVITSYGLPTWRPVADPVPATTTTSEHHIWEDWISSSTTSSSSVAPTTTSSSTHTWEDWTSSSTSTKPVDPVTSSSSSETWGDWTLTQPTQVATSATGGSWDAPGTTATAATTVTTASGGWGVPSSSASSSPVPKPSGGSYPGITPNGDSWGLTYSPYTAQGGCKDASTVAKDLAIVAAKGFSSVRVYSTDCDTLENVGKSARDNGLKIIIGVWISSAGIGAAKPQVDDIVAWGQWDLVELIVVGNEVIFNNIASAGDLAGFISSSTWAFKSAGYTGPVTTTEPLSVWEDSHNAATLGGVIDVIGANLYAFFNAQISADKAGKFIQDQINIINGIFNKPVYVLESGWPHGGNANGAAVPSPENQAIALKGIQAAVGAQVVFLSYEDEPWKEPGQFGVEQFWGCANVF